MSIDLTHRFDVRVVDGHALVVGRPALLTDWSMHPDRGLERARPAAEAAGQTAIVAFWDGVIRGLLAAGGATRTSVGACRLCHVRRGKLDTRSHGIRTGPDPPAMRG